MNHYTYEVIKEVTNYDITESKVVDRFDNPSDALKMCDVLRKKEGDYAWFFVQVQWGSIDNV